MAEENPFARLFNAAPTETVATLAQLAPGSSTDKIEIKLIARPQLTTASPTTAHLDWKRKMSRLMVKRWQCR
jgi:hypothetical protein